MTASNPPIKFNGVTYYLRQCGYYETYSTIAREKGVELRLHRAMWVAANGPIPDGFVVHHKDECKTNNFLDNFECIPKEQHDREGMTKLWGEAPKEKISCAWCKIICQRILHGNARTKKYCSRKCKETAKKFRRLQNTT